MLDVKTYFKGTSVPIHIYKGVDYNERISMHNSLPYNNILYKGVIV